jgi:hypothetical protein
MSAINEPFMPTAADELVAVLPETRWDRFEFLLARISERLNPILVKEARQALKSRQFTSTFFLMLIAGWAWSILGLARLGPEVQYSADGPTMFYVYFLILAFPLIIVAPYSAYHSLSSERQDRTYELVSITALNARQILTGKLGGILLQMLVYLSAIFPCLAFTYLLRGLDIFTIILAVAYTCSVSIGASAVGLLLAALSPPRQRQIVIAVLFAMMLFLCFIVAIYWMFFLIATGGFLTTSPYFWPSNLGALTFFLNFFALVFLAARSQLTTVCQNRSTALRVALVVAQLSWLAWMAGVQLGFGRFSMSGFLLFTAMFWFFAGAFMTGEPGVLSERVRRDLPQSVLGRVFFSWFVPGPGTGYMFAVSNVVAAAVMANFPFHAFAAMFKIPVPVLTVTGVAPSFLDVSLVTAGYVIIYLGLGKLILSAIGRFTEVRLVTRFLVHACLVMFGAGVPLVIQWSIPQIRNSGYTPWQITNAIWTIWESCAKVVPYPDFVVPVVTIAAVCVWAVNLPSVAAELQQVYLPKPPRVAEEDTLLAAEAAGPPLPTSPWDDAAER